MANALLLQSPEGLKPLDLTPILARVYHVPFQDAVSRAKRCWGILAENLEASEADRLAAQFQAAGLAVKVVPQDSLTVLPEPKALARADEGVWEKFRGERVSLVAAAAFNRMSMTTKTVEEGPSAGTKALKLGILLTTGVPLPIGGKRKVEKTQEHAELVFYLDIFLKNPAEHWRIDAQAFDYTYLKERKLYQVLGNFRLLVGDLVNKAPSARRNRGARILLENKPIREMGYESLRDLDRESRWLLSL